MLCSMIEGPGVTLMAFDTAGKLLPPGLWRVFQQKLASSSVIAVEDMPKEWRDAIDDAHRVGQMIRLDPPHQDFCGTGDEP